jgi:hypothetical protein
VVHCPKRVTVEPRPLRPSRRPQGSSWLMPTLCDARHASLLCWDWPWNGNSEKRVACRLIASEKTGLISYEGNEKRIRKGKVPAESPTTHQLGRRLVLRGEFSTASMRLCIQRSGHHRSEHTPTNSDSNVSLLPDPTLPFHYRTVTEYPVLLTMASMSRSTSDRSTTDVVFAAGA